MRRITILCVVLMFVILPLTAQELKIATSFQEGSVLYQLLDNYYQELAERTQSGISVVLVNRPLLRGEEQVKEGVIDGDAARLEEVYEGADTVVKVPEAVLGIPYNAFTIRDMVIDGPEDLKNLLIVTMRGNKTVSEFAKQYSLRVQYVDSIPQAFKMVAAKRADLVITAGQVAAILQTPEFKDLGIKVINPPILMVPHYLFLNEKHKALVPVLSKVVKEMRESGRTAEIFSPPPKEE